MKKHILPTLLALLLSLTAHTQSCLPNGIIFYSQAEIDNFPANYPGCAAIEGQVSIAGFDITNLDGLQQITSIGEYLSISNNPVLTDLSGLNNVVSINGLVVTENASLTDLNGLNQLDSIRFTVSINQNPALTTISGLNNLRYVGTDFYIDNNSVLTNLNGLGGLHFIGGNFDFGINPSLSSLSGLTQLSKIGGFLRVTNYTPVTSFSGLENLISVGGLLIGNTPITNFEGLNNLKTITGDLYIGEHTMLTSLSGLENLESIGGGMAIGKNHVLTNLSPLSNLSAVGSYLAIYENPALMSLSGLEFISTITGMLEIKDNAQLSDCAIYTVCNHLSNLPNLVTIQNNAPGCTAPAEVGLQCTGTPVQVEVLLDNNGDCLPDPTDSPVPGVQVRLTGNAQMALLPTDAQGFAHFNYLETGTFSLHLPQFPNANWTLCQNTFQLDPNGSTDTLKASFLLNPLGNLCPELTVDLGLPSVFRNCSAASTVQVFTKNTGNAPAAQVTVGVVLPTDAFEILSSSLPVAAASGDTLFFDAGDLAPFSTATLQLEVKTKCDTVLLGHTLCVEAFSSLENGCLITPSSASEIRLTSQCDGDSVRFVLQNIGNAPTQNPHEFFVLKNQVILDSGTFSLNPQETRILALPANGATWRLEATKLDDGTLTATGIEGCGGLTPGLLHAFWLEKGPLNYDFDCRTVVDSPFANQKSANPTGGSAALLTTNHPLQYTLDFQNTGTDTVTTVLLRDILPPNFDAETFRPIAASHPYTWGINGAETLEIRFDSIDLPGSNTNEAASHGFFSFQIFPKPGLATGANFLNTATISFDAQPPVSTNQVYHVIGVPAVLGQTCGQGFINFDSQASVDNFQINNPGCTIIEGDVSIGGQDITNLAGLSDLVEIKGSFGVNADILQNLNGLDNLKTVDGNVNIVFNASLNTLGLDNLQSVGGFFDIRGNGALDSLAGLHRLISVGKKLEISDNSNLLNLSGLQALTTIGEDLNVTNNAVLTAFHGFQKLKTVGGSVIISNNPALLNLNGLDSLMTIDSSLTISSNTMLTEINGLRGLVSVGKNLDINSNNVLGGDDWMPRLQTVRSHFAIASNHGLDTLSGFNSLTQIGGSFGMSGNFNLKAITAFDHLENTDNAFEIYGHYNLMTINGFQALNTVGGYFFIRENVGLDTLGGFGNLDTIGGPFWLQNNGALAYISGFENLKTIKGEFLIQRNYFLKNFDGFGVLNFISGNLAIDEEYELEKMTAFNNLDSISGNVSMTYNTVLQDVKNFQKLSSIGGQLRMYRCSALLDLSGLDSLTHVFAISIEGCHLLKNLEGLDNVGNTFEIELLDNPGLMSLSSLDKVFSVERDVIINSNPQLMMLDGLNNLASVGSLKITENVALTSLANFENIINISGSVWIWSNAALPNLSGLENVETIGDNLYINSNASLNSLSSLKKMTQVYGDVGIFNNPLLVDLDGLDSLNFVGKTLSINTNPALTSLNGLNHLIQANNQVDIIGNNLLINLEGLSRLNYTWRLNVSSNPAMTNLDGLDSLAQVGFLTVVSNAMMTDLNGLENLHEVSQDINISDNTALTSMEGLNELETIGGYLQISGNSVLPNLNGLDNLGSIGVLNIQTNNSLASLTGIENVSHLGGATITQNPLLETCSFLPICIAVRNNSANIFANAPGCNSPEEIKDQCGPVPVNIVVKTDPDGDCIPDANNVPQAEVQVVFQSNGQTVLKPTDTSGVAQFEYADGGFIYFQLTQYPTNLWAVCPFNPSISTDTLTQTSIQKEILLAPIPQCPELKVDLALPSNFRSCLVESQVQVSAQNTGTIAAESVVLAVVVPAVMVVLDTDYPIASQSGDTLFFDLGEIAPLSGASVLLTVRTNCDTFLIDHTLCWGASATAENLCPDNHPPRFETQIMAQCLGDTTVRFTLTNIGNAPMPEPFLYTLIRNADIIQTGFFDLAVQQSIEVNVPADGATYRMQAPKHGDGSFAANAIENCGGLTPGLITAFWLDEGPLHYDFDCRQVIGSFDPNQKTAVPTGVGTDHIITANRPLQYTIDFQNTGTDTAFRVLLRDVLPDGLNISTFRPAFASHPYSWEIRGMGTLEVLFFPIALPDSNVNEPASHGFFTFEIDQFVNHPDGVIFENTAAIVFDFNPPIITNTVIHTIGSLIVTVDEPKPQRDFWRVAGNPTREMATFSAVNPIPGVKRFELFDTGGRLVRLARFEGQSFEFHRESLPAGMYFFSIADERGKRFGGKIVVVD